MFQTLAVLTRTFLSGFYVFQSLAQGRNYQINFICIRIKTPDLEGIVLIRLILSEVRGISEMAH